MVDGYEGEASPTDLEHAIAPSILAWWTSGWWTHRGITRCGGEMGPRGILPPELRCQLTTPKVDKCLTCAIYICLISVSCWLRRWVEIVFDRFAALYTIEIILSMTGQMIYSYCYLGGCWKGSLFASRAFVYTYNHTHTVYIYISKKTSIWSYVNEASPFSSRNLLTQTQTKSLNAHVGTSWYSWAKKCNQFPRCDSDCSDTPALSQTTPKCF